MPKLPNLTLINTPVKLTAEQRAYYRAVGDGQVSRGVRREADRAMAIADASQNDRYLLAGPSMTTTHIDNKGHK